MNGASRLALPGFDPALPAPAASATGKAAGAGRGAGTSAAFLDFLQELATASGCGAAADAAPEENAEPAPDYPPGGATPAQAKRGSRAASAAPARQTGAGDTAGTTGLELPALPVPDAASRRDGLGMGAGAALPGSGETADTADAAGTASAASRNDAAGIRARGWLPGGAAPAVQPGIAEPTGSGQQVNTAGGGQPAVAAGGAQEVLKDAIRARGSAPSARLSQVNLASRPAMGQALADAPASGGKRWAEASVNRSTPSEASADTAEAGRQWQATPQSTAARSVADGAEASVPPADAGASPADRSGDPSGLADLSAPALDPGVAGARLLLGNNGADPKRASAAAADEGGQQQPAAELAFAARLSPGESERVRRAGGPDSAGLDAGNGQLRGATGGSAQDVVSPAWGSATPEEAGAQSDAAPASNAPGKPSAASPANTPAASESTGPVAHDIKLELTGTGPRVEVRLVERAGEVHVAVRTPDGRLADAMRDDLPALAARLEQSGFHGSEWRTGTAGGGQRTLEIDHTGGAAREFQGDPNGRGRQQPGQEKGQERPRAQAQPTSSQGKEFSRLISSLRGTREES